jgi:hypothetical protein
MTKVEDRTIVKIAKEALLADREGLKELFRGVLQEVLESRDDGGRRRGKESADGRPALLPLGLLHARAHHAAWKDRASCAAGPPGAILDRSGFGGRRR